MFAKSDVNGKNENPIYTFLKSRCPSVRKEFQAPYKLYYDPYHQDDIRWNFEKFLIDHRGQPVRRMRIQSTLSSKVVVHLSEKSSRLLT